MPDPDADSDALQRIVDGAPKRATDANGASFEQFSPDDLARAAALLASKKVRANRALGLTKILPGGTP